MALKGIPGEYLKDLSDCRLKNPRQEEFLDKLLLVQSNPKLTAVQKAKETVELLKPLQSTVMPKFIVALIENEPEKNVEDMKYWAVGSIFVQCIVFSWILWFTLIFPLESS